MRDFQVDKARFHVHFGAGRLGMGLVVPAVAASGMPFAVVQRPKPRWQEVFDSSKRGDGRIDFKVTTFSHHGYGHLKERACARVCARARCPSCF